MRIAIYGAGAIGGHLAARLARGGAEVSVVARGAHLRAIQARGLLLRAADGEIHCHPRASDNPADLGPQDAVLVCTKTPALPEVAAGIAPLLREETPVAFVMNGLPWWFFCGFGGPRDGEAVPEADPDGSVRRVVGTARAVGGVVWSACTVAEPGVVVSEHPSNRLVLGEIDGRVTERLTRIAALLEAGGMQGRVIPDIRAEVWAKLMNNLSNGPFCLLSRLGLKPTLEDPAVYAAAVRCAEEAAAIARAYGGAVEGSAEGRVRRSANIAHKPSILQDLEAGRPMEIDTLFRAPLRLAREAGVATPTLDLVVTLAIQAARAAGVYRG
ncbi:MAG TPA: 2-dehydropantoate 2-reductase [Acetobacteraceae bacterium]|nr:2-dehydropantoate 2-reductase [Acetobacteraceae bacterium]